MILEKIDFSDTQIIVQTAKKTGVILQERRGKQGQGKDHFSFFTRSSILANNSVPVHLSSL